MNTLLITAHPNGKDSSIGGIIEKFETVCINQTNQNIEIIDLYEHNWQQPFYSPALENNENFLDTRKKIQQKIEWADELVFIHPLWWGGSPAVLKNFIDANITSKFAYQYPAKDPKSKLISYPQGLLKGKTAKVYITGDTPSWWYSVLGNPFFLIYKYLIFEFIGLKVVDMKYFGEMRKKSPYQKEQLFNKIKIT